MSSPIMNADLVRIMNPSIQKVFTSLQSDNQLKASDTDRFTSYSRYDFS